VVVFGGAGNSIVGAVDSDPSTTESPAGGTTMELSNCRTETDSLAWLSLNIACIAWKLAVVGDVFEAGEDCPARERSSRSSSPFNPPS
jgi:hypothetical protein